MTYIHELDDWPNFTWSSQALSLALSEVRHKQGKQLGRMEALGFALRTEASVTALTHEAMKSSAIEGEHLDSDEVRSSIARRIGLDAAALPAPGREADGVVEMVLDATQHFAQPLTAERLFRWHAALFPAPRTGTPNLTVGAWRTDAQGPMQVVSGAMGKERVHFQAPPASRVADEMDRFFEWFNRTTDADPVLRAGVAHLWFVTVHPFDDGNGRIARAIADLSLARSDGSADRFYSMSAGIEAERKHYYRQLESAQRGSLDVTAWLAWFLGCLDRAIDGADAMLGTVLHKARLWQQINAAPVNDRQRKAINRMLEHDWEGHLTTSKYARLNKCSQDTAGRDINELRTRGILIKNPGGGRSTSYRLATPQELSPDSASGRSEN